MTVCLETNELLVVRSSWCQGMHSSRTKRYGNRSTVRCKIFFSSNTNDKPDFTLDVKNNFDASKASYIGHGRILKTFSKYYNLKPSSRSYYHTSFPDIIQIEKLKPTTSCIRKFLNEAKEHHGNVEE